MNRVAAAALLLNAVLLHAVVQRYLSLLDAWERHDLARATHASLATR
ncbi:MAG: hypothetical protein FJ090_07395 [Deltaproteobacteria bacterium]|nr:hypothetical protein [Deltaproteobacteria bacterium]